MKCISDSDPRIRFAILSSALAAVRPDPQAAACCFGSARLREALKQKVSPIAVLGDGSVLPKGYEMNTKSANRVSARQSVVTPPSKGRQQWGITQSSVKQGRLGPLPLPGMIRAVSGDETPRKESSRSLASS